MKKAPLAEPSRPGELPAMKEPESKQAEGKSPVFLLPESPGERRKKAWHGHILEEEVLGIPTIQPPS